MFVQSPKNLALAGGCLFACACATYPDRTQRALGDFQGGQLTRAQDAYADPHTTGSPFLAGAESGTVALAAGNWDGAIKSFGAAVDEVRETERSALISPESLGETVLSFTINEGARRYEGEGYERVLLHASLATAYLAKGDLEGARVEVKRSNALLESEEALYKKEYKAGGFGHFLSAVTYELEGQLDDAWIDYDRMRKKGVGTELAGRALARIAKKTHREDDLGPDAASFADTEEPDGSSSVVVIAAVGLAPFKKAGTLPIPTESGILQWSIPIYESRPQPVSGLELSVAGGNRSVRTVTVEDLGRVARENLEDRIAWLIAKSTVRAFLKRELTRKLEDEMGILGRIAGDVFAFVSERADLRCWQTLPDSLQAARVFLPAGRNELRLKALGGEEQDLGTFETTPGETMFVIARTIGSKLYAYPIGGRRVTTEPTPTAAPAATP